MVYFDKIRATKNRVQDKLLATPGVDCLMIFSKPVAGKAKGKAEIIVYLIKKKPISALSADEIVPAEIDGVKTDAIGGQM